VKIFYGRKLLGVLEYNVSEVNSVSGEPEVIEHAANEANKTRFIIIILLSQSKL